MAGLGTGEKEWGIKAYLCATVAIAECLSLGDFKTLADVRF